MHIKKRVAAAVILAAAALSAPLISQTVKTSGRWVVVSCNTDGTYTCAYQSCIMYCCPI